MKLGLFCSHEVNIFNDGHKLYEYMNVLKCNYKYEQNIKLRTIKWETI